MVFVLWGTNSYMRDAELRRRIASHVEKHGDFGVEHYDAAEVTYDSILAAATTLPFLSDARLVVVKNFSANKVLLEKIENFITQSNADTEVLLIDGKLDKRTAWYKFIVKKVNTTEYAPLDARNVERWLIDEAAKRGGRIQGPDARLLIARVGEDQQFLSHELDKLLAYDASITKETIELLCDPIPQSTIFMMIESLFNGRLREALSLYDEQRRQRVEPQAMMGMVAWQMHLVALAKAAGSKPAQEVAREAGVAPFAFQKSQGLARRLTMTEIRQLFGYLTEADLRTKSESVDADRLMQTVLIKIARTVG